ncbi:MAG: phenylalanine 4-monooxygenase, partial [Flavobacteriaceae bacterium]|nr:phenylalanine 4-monooxygenase [Flavobacteriaceae bacterium]
STVGQLEGINIAIEDMSPKDLEVYGIIEGKTTSLKFEGGITVEGKIITGKRDLQGKIILITFKNCKVSYKEKVLFDPSWGVYDMAIGKHISSAYAGPADPNSFEEMYSVSKTKTVKITYSKKEQRLHQLYKIVKNQRSTTLDFELISEVFSEVLTAYPSEWLLFLELYELVFSNNTSLKKEIYAHLQKLKQNPDYSKLITDGLALITKT